MGIESRLDDVGNLSRLAADSGLSDKRVSEPDLRPP